MRTRSPIVASAMILAAGLAQAQTGSHLCDIALVMPGTSIWHMDTARGGGFSVATQLGAVGDQYIAGEPIPTWRDGRDEAIAFRRGQWTVKRNVGGAYPGTTTSFSYGAAGDRAIIGDFNGDGVPEVGVMFPSIASRPGPVPALVSAEYVCLRIDLNHNLREDESGQPMRLTLAPKDRIFAAKFGGPAGDDLAVWRDSTGNWEIYRNIGVSWGTPTFSPTPIVAQFGLPGDLPMAGDVNGDGRADLMVFRPSNCRVYINLWAWDAFKGWAGVFASGRVDRIIDYTWSIGLVNQANRRVGMAWNAGAVSIRVD